LIGIANLSPPKNVNEIDSFMYQTVGSEGLEMIAKCLEVPLIQREIKGKSIEQ
jgi:diphthine-ammonia ligase